MPFITLGTGDDLILSIPTVRTTNWDTDFQANFAQKITDHDHTGSGKGRLITTAALAPDSITGAKILLSNEEYLRGRNAADSADINIIKVNASDLLEVGATLANFNISNATYLTGRNNADTANINMIQVNTNDKLALGADLANLSLINDVSLLGRNNADTSYLAMLKINTSDKIATGADFANLALINDQYFQARNNANSAYINTFKVKTDDTLTLQPDVSLEGSLTLEDYLTQVDVTFTIADNQSSAANVTGALVTETEGYSFKLHYSIYVDATTDLLEKGEAEFTYVNGAWQQDRSYSRDDSQVIFSVASGQLKYTSPAYTGYSAATLTYQIIEL